MTLKNKKRIKKKTKTLSKTSTKTYSKTNNVKNQLIIHNKLTPTRLWYIQNFKNKYLKFEMNSKLREYFNSNSHDINYLYGTYNRLHTFIIFAYTLNIDIVNTICLTFKIKDSTTGDESIFAFGYYSIDKPNKNKSNLEKQRVLALSGSKLQISYFVLGGSFLSKDGEYRSSCISALNMKAIDKYPYKSILMDINNYIKEKLFERKFLINKEYFFPTDDKKTLESNLEYYAYLIQFDIFSYTWFNLMYNINLNIIENNLNDKYKKIMLKHKDEDLQFFKTLLKKYNSVDIESFRRLTNNMKIGKTPVVDFTKLGQKIIPLSISEVQNPFNLQYKPWREYLISIHLSDLVINYISPGFFITNQWFYIKNSRKGLFDNDIQYEKMARSELAEQITTLLIRANLYTHENITTKKKFMKKTQKTIASWMSDKFKVLSDKIQDPIDYAKEEIIMSNVALCFMSEYVGRTIMDVVTLCKTSDYYNNLVGDPFSLKGFPIFNKYMFDICYNLYCMNYRSGLIHGDLHLNNATIKPMVYKSIRDINYIKDPTVLYILGDSKEQYIFPTVAYHACLIDFSRSIILPNKIDNFQDKSLPKSYSIITKLKEFQDDQVERLLRLYIHYTTDSAHNKDELRIMFKNKFEAVFKLLSVTDIYGFTQKLLMVFKIRDSTIVTPHKLINELVEKINKSAQHYLTVEMNKLISTPSYEDEIMKMEWPIYTIIKKIFSNNLVVNQNIGNITDVFNINNKLQYSLTKFSLFPPILTHPKSVVNGKIIEHSKTEPYVKNYNNARIKYENDRYNNMKVVNYIASRQREKHF